MTKSLQIEYYSIKMQKMPHALGDYHTVEIYMVDTYGKYRAEDIQAMLVFGSESEALKEFGRLQHLLEVAFTDADFPTDEFIDEIDEINEKQRRANGLALVNLPMYSGLNLDI